MHEDVILKKKAEYFYKNKIVVHIKKNNGLFNNGLILEFVGDMIIIDDRLNGATPIYLLEIKEIEPKREEK